MKEIVKNVVNMVANVQKFCNFASTVPVLLPIRTACGSSYFIATLFLYLVINVNPKTNG